jgi:hypothetical protein
MFQSKFGDNLVPMGRITEHGGGDAPTTRAREKPGVQPILSDHLDAPFNERPGKAVAQWLHVSPIRL